MTEIFTYRPDEDSAQERARIMRLISERWNGNLQAYLEAVARVRASGMQSAQKPEPDVAVQSMVRLARRP